MVVDEQIAGAREMFPEIDQPGIGKMRVTATAQKLSRTKACPRKGAPLLGEDNLAVYGRMLGYDAEKLAELKAKGVI
jgi:formyl-CoA transferase